jgi:O-antigen ligase
MLRLTAPLREAPATVPALGALALMAVWATDQAGYPQTHWAPGGLIVLALVAIALMAARPRLAEIPLAVRVAVGCLAAYTALSFLSILWAGVPGDAWEGADRTLLYLLVFALFACCAQRGATAALLLSAWVLAVIGVALFALLHVNAAAGSAARLQELLPGGRLVYPAGYVNANAAQWLMAFWPALLLARSRPLPWGLRGVLAGGAVLLAEVALLSQSRGSVYATPVMLVLVFTLLPGRVRTFALGVPVAVGIGAAAPAVLRVGERVSAAESAAAALHSGPAVVHGAALRTVAVALRGATVAVHGATVAIVLSALAVGLVVAVGAALESRRSFSRSTQARVHRTLAVLAGVLLVAGLAGGWAAAGDPLARARHAWDTFKSSSGYGADATTGSRLTSGLGSNRYDFYRVALDEFAAHPVGGIGADNFAEQYLAHGRSEETPHYPHSVELRTLAETGLVGALLAAVGLGAALLACRRAIARNPDPLARAVAAAAVAGFAYWVVHGSFDWFWEFAGLGAPAFALLGLACALAPRADTPAAAAPEGSDPGPSGESSFGGLYQSASPMGSILPAASPTGSIPPAASPTGSIPPAASPTGSIPPAASPTGSPPAVGSSAGRPARAVPARRRGRWPILVGAVAALAAVVSFTAPWLSRLQVQSAARIWVRAPAQAYARLDDAARLNPLSDEPYVVAGSIALRLGELGRADRDFALALGRTPGDAYATLERGAIASTEGRRHEARVLLERAARLDPRDRLTRAALELARRGRKVDIGELNRSILRNAGQLS